MNQLNCAFRTLSIVLMWLVVPQLTLAQGYDTPLTFQGLSHRTSQSAASRAAGGITFALRSDVSVMFTNPALLTSLQDIQLSVGAVQQYVNDKQDQLYGGLQNYSAFNLLMQGTTWQVSDPESVLVNQADSVQRPFDTIGPTWGRKASKGRPLQLMVAVPFSIETVRLVAGLGVVEYANLNRYYQNNNCLSPSVLSVLDSTISTRNLNTNPYVAQWYQYYQQRDGTIRGYGGALSAVFAEKLSVGVSGMLLKGTTDDQEVRVGRGRLVFYNNSLRLDKMNVSSYVKTGTSDYSGADFTFSARYSGRNFDIGFAVKPPTTITRTYTGSFSADTITAVSLLSHRVDSLHAVGTTSLSGEDKMKLPWQWTIGFAVRVLENLSVGLEYEIRSYASATYTAPDGTASNPWLSSSAWHIGIEYRPNPWLALRAGARDYAEVYEPLSNAIRGDPVSYGVYSAGFGVTFANAHLNVAYEYYDMKYVDTWSNAASINREFLSSFVASIAYDVPW